MKLELKHLIAYLPYGLQIKILNHKCDYVGIEQAAANGYYMIGADFYVTYEGGSTGKSINSFTPILRPLSDLRNEITSPNYYNGEPFTPIYHNFNGEVLDYDLEYEKDVEGCQSCFIPILTGYGIVQTLLEWHFDVFGLIPAGLAIDINTI